MVRAVWSSGDEGRRHASELSTVAGAPTTSGQALRRGAVFVIERLPSGARQRGVCREWAARRETRTIATLSASEGGAPTSTPA